MRITLAQPPGLLKATCSKNGNLLVRLCGSMVYVRKSPWCLRIVNSLLNGSWIGKKCALVSVITTTKLFFSALTLSISSTIIEEVLDVCQTGLATLAFFYFDFRDAPKKDVHGLLSSLLVQLSNQSDNFCTILSELYSAHNNGSRQPSEDALMKCLKDMLRLPGQGEIYIVVDALDESPDVSGYPTPREEVLMNVQELVELRLPHVHFCFTCRPEVDIRDALQALAVHNVSLHEQAGQHQDISDYIKFVVYSDPKIRRWREEDRQLVIKTLTEKSGGM